MNYYETAVRKRSIVYKILRELIDEKIEKAETEQERARLIEQRNELDREFCGAFETREV